jgi:hypothetical protein
MRSLLVAGILLAAVEAGATSPAADVEACMRANMPSSVRVQAVEVTSYDRAGEARVLRGRIFGTRADERSQVMARVEFPGDLAGAAFLVRDGADAAAMYMYLPSVNRVKRLAGPVMTGKLWGTDFSYNEFRQITAAFAGGAAVHEGMAQLGGRPVHRLKLTPGPAEQQPYSAIDVLVDQQTCVPLRAEFRAGERVRKVFTVSPADLRQAGSHWYAGQMDLRDMGAGTHTQLRVLGIAVGVALSASYFHPQQFHSVR